MDIVSPAIRSAIMSKVRSKGNKSTERKLRAILAGVGIKGWRTNARDITGTPDVAFEKMRLAIFVDGCFWHGCPKCYRRPKSKRKFWDAKVVENRARDRRVTRRLKAAGWDVIRLYECEFGSNRQDLLDRIRKRPTNACNTTAREPRRG